MSIERSCRIVTSSVATTCLACHRHGCGFRAAMSASNSKDIGVPPLWMKYILAKGFIALDGSSLTWATLAPAKAAST